MTLFTQDRPSILAGGAALIALSACWIWSIFFITTELHQGEVYRIIYLHVPAAFTSFFCAFLLFIYSIFGLVKKQERFLRNAKACAEVGLIFTLLTLATGSIWGKPTWGTWWTWDARLTTTFLLGLLYAGFLLLHSSMSQGPGRIKVCSAIGILIFADVPIIYKSVTWWRTLHQPPSIKPSATTISPEILNFLLICIGVTLLVSVWMIIERTVNLRLKEDLDDASYQQMKKQES
jgi:heme exporter protein C